MALHTRNPNYSTGLSPTAPSNALSRRVAQGGAVSAIRGTKSVTPISDFPSTSAKNCPTEPSISTPATVNPRSSIVNSSAARELFPTYRASFNSTQPSVARSSAFTPATGFSMLHAKFGLPQSSGLHSLPTANKSLDSATFNSLLHSRESKFLIPPFRLNTAPTSDLVATPDSSGGEIPNAALGNDSALANLDKKEPNAPPVSSYYTIVLDLDETLCCNRGPGKAILRPGAIDLLKALRSLSTPQRPVEIVLWTASVESLARQVLVRLDPDGTCFTDYIFRDRRWFKETGYTKDLRLLGRDMERVVIVENSPMSVTLNRAQAILVKDFLGHSPHDCDLKVVREILEGWITAIDFVPIREWLARHPKVDRNNHVIAAPSVGSIVAAHRTGLSGSVGQQRSPAVSFKSAFPVSVVAGKRW